jgi:hypothetical protein
LVMQVPVKPLGGGPAIRLSVTQEDRPPCGGIGVCLRHGSLPERTNLSPYV